MNNIIGYFKNDSTIINNEYDFDYVHIELLGNHAKKNDDNKNTYMMVSKSDLNIVMNFKWYLNTSSYPSTYGTFDKEIQFSRPVPLHQILFPDTPHGNVIDHINRNKLDNRRENLRMCTALQNSYNKSKPKNSSNRYKGVSVCGKKNPSYTASISKGGIKHEIKDIKTEEDAARIYDMMAEELFGEYAAKNF